MSDKELRIKYILDRSQFDAGIKAANQGLKDTGKHLEDGTQSALSMTKAMLGMAGVSTGLGAVQQVVAAINQSMQEAADYTKKVAEAFGSTREAMREIAAIAGKGLTNNFVSGQLDMAARAKILTPQEMNSGTLAFQQYGSAYIGEQGVDPATGKDNGSRIGQGQLDELLPSVFSAAKIQGVEQGAAGQIFAKIVQALPAHSKTSDYKDAFAKVLETAKNSSGSATMTANQLGPFLSANVGEGGAYAPTMEGLLMATKHIAAVSEVNPQEAGPYTNQMVQDLNRIDIKGKDNDFGITDDMDPDQKVKAIAAKWKAETGGKNFKKWYSQKLGGRMGNVQATTALSALILKGIDGGFFDAMEAKAAKVSGASLDETLAEHLETDPQTRDDASKASTAIGEARRGLELSDVASLKNRARDELTNDPTHPFESYGLGNMLRGSYLGGGYPVKDQLVNERALEMARQQAADAGVDVSPKFGEFAPPVGMGSAEQAMNNEIKRVLERIASATERAAGSHVPNVINGKPNVGFPR